MTFYLSMNGSVVYARDRGEAESLLPGEALAGPVVERFGFVRFIGPRDSIAALAHSLDLAEVDSREGDALLSLADEVEIEIPLAHWRQRLAGPCVAYRHPKSVPAS